VFACALCGALQGDAAAVDAVESARRARERGFDPLVHPLVECLEDLRGLTVVGASGGDPERRIWPFVQFAVGADGLGTVENLVKTLRLGAARHALHWIVEVEYAHRLVFALKPRFHRSIDAITPALVESAVADLDRIRRDLVSNQRLSWWRDGSNGPP
jgi:hypothetical protein